MSDQIKIGTNGVPFGKGYKGKGMCGACAYQSETHVPNRPGEMLCTYYASTCKQVSRNCSGIKFMKEDNGKIATNISTGEVNSNKEDH